MSERRRKLGRGFSLLEAVVVVVLLGIAAPPGLSLMGEAAVARGNAVNAARATAFAQGLMEHLLADVHSGADGLGFDALANPSAYETGLRERAAEMAGVYEPLGFSWRLEVGPLVGPAGTATGAPARDRFRVATVFVSYPLASGGRIEMPMSAMVGEIPTGEAP